jgi:hypothetical protein
MQSFLSASNQTWIFSADFRKSTQIPNFMKILPVGTELDYVEGRTDGQTDRYEAANCRFSQFCESTLKCSLAHWNLDSLTCFLFVQMTMMMMIMMMMMIIIISCTRKTFVRFTTKDSYTWNITHTTESTAVWNLKPERWGSPLVQEKYQEEKACDKRYPYRITTIIIIIIIIIIYGFWTHVLASNEIWINSCQ